MGLVADGHVEVRPLVDLGGNLLGTHDDHYVLVAGDLRKGIGDGLTVHGQVDDLSLEVLDSLLPAHTRLNRVVSAEALDDTADVSLQDLVVCVDVDALGSKGPGGERHMRGYTLVPLGTVAYPHDPDFGHFGYSSRMGSILWPR